MIKGIRHTGLVVRDLNKSLHFYAELLDFKIWLRKTEKGAYIETIVNIKGSILDWVKLKAPDNSVIELIEYKWPKNKYKEYVEISPSDRLGCSHFAISVCNIEDLYLLLCKYNIHCNCSPQLTPDRKAKVLYCHDPDGIIVELVEDLCE